MSADVSLPTTAEEIVNRLPPHKRTLFRENLQIGQLSYSKRTRRALDVHWRGWLKYIDDRGLPILAPHLQQLATFLQGLAETRKLATLDLYLFAIRRLHLWAEEPNPLETDAGRLLLRKIRNGTSNEQRKKAPLRLEELDRILNSLSTSSFREVQDAAIISVAYEAMLGPGDLVILELSCVEFNEDGRAFIWIETHGADTPELVRRILTAETTDRLRRWIQVSGITSGRLFRGSSGSAAAVPRLHESFHEGGIRRRIKHCCRRAGLNPSNFTGMSALKGAAEDLVTSGASLRAVARAGRYDSLQMVTRYTEHLGLAEDVMYQMLSKRRRK
jgi:integrase